MLIIVVFCVFPILDMDVCYFKYVYQKIVIETFYRYKYYNLDYDKSK